jgi:hypothetical protein
MSKQLGRQQIRQERRREEQRRREEERRRAARAKRNLTIGAIVGSVLVVALAISIYVFLIAPNSMTNSSALNPPVDKISCDQLEQTATHFHVHVTLYVNGAPVQIPQQIGIASDSSAPSGTCFYWLHTHDTTGVIHIEAPKDQNFTLGNFVHIWGKQFSQLNYQIELDQTDGWQAFVDGKPYSGDFHNMVLKSHMVITLAYQSPDIQPDTTFDWVKANLAQ